MQGKYARFKIFSLPNLLSVFRILLIPVIIMLFFTPRRGVEAAAVLILSGITDLVDGAIARRFNMITELGKVLDPLADKLTQATVCVCLVVQNVGLFWLLFLFVVKEGLMIAGGAKIIKRGLDLGSSKWFGKLSTVVFYVVMILIIALELEKVSPTVEIMILVALGFMVFSFFMYLRIFLDLVKNKN